MTRLERAERIIGQLATHHLLPIADLEVLRECLRLTRRHNDLVEGIITRQLREIALREALEAFVAEHGEDCRCPKCCAARRALVQT